MKNNIITQKTAGILLVLSATALLVPYTVLTMIFDYPNILRQDAGAILTKFYAGGPQLIWTWFAFAATGLPLIPAYIMIGQWLEGKSTLVRMATNIGVAGLIVQMIGLLRWTFVVPVLADTFVHTTDASVKAAAIVSFKTIHQFGGVLLGEHLGQLFTIAWTVLMTVSFAQLKLFPRWVNVLAYVSSGIYLAAQAELFAIVIPGFPVCGPAGFIGSTLWLVWLIIVGLLLLRKKTEL